MPGAGWQRSGMVQVRAARARLPAWRKRSAFGLLTRRCLGQCQDPGDCLFGFEAFQPQLRLLQLLDLLVQLVRAAARLHACAPGQHHFQVTLRAPSMPGRKPERIWWLQDHPELPKAARERIVQHQTCRSAAPPYLTISVASALLRCSVVCADLHLYGFRA